MAQPQLNGPQRAAVEHIHGPLLVLAGAGSGKTRVITEKIAHLIRNCQHDASRVAAVTFTNKAAREMQTRVSALLTRGQKKGLTVSTFHSLGLSILRAEHELAGYRPNFSILDSQDALGLIAELAGRGHAQRNQILISQAKGAFGSPDEEADGAQAALAGDLLRKYRRQLRAYNAVDLDDLITLPVEILAGNSEALGRWQTRFHYLLVDEYQDTNMAQYQLLRLLTSGRGTFTVVGDDDQSVYGWRGARPDNLIRLQEDFPALEVIKLEQNFRSCNRILSVANRLIETNTRLFEKKLWSQHGPGDPPRVLNCAHEQDEAERVISEIISHRIRAGSRNGDYAVLYRSNYQARIFENALRERNVPYALSGGQSFFDRQEIKDVVAYLRLLANPDDDTAFLRIINVPRREVGAATLEKLGDYARERGISLFQAAGEIHWTDNLRTRAATHLQQFHQLLEEFGRRAEAQPASEVLNGLLNEIDYAGWLRQSAAGQSQADRKRANVADLTKWIERMTDGDESAGLSEAVRRLGLRDMLEQRDDDGDDRVQLMTLHSGKGLEFPHVFLVGLEEGLLPHHNSMEAHALEEERRLLYVGITRAKKSVTLTYARKRKQGKNILERQPSRFLYELAGEELEWEGQPGVCQSDEEKRASGQRHLEGLRDLLT